MIPDLHKQLKEATNLETDAVILLLTAGRSQREMGQSQFYKEIILPLNTLLQQAALARATAQQAAAVREPSASSATSRDTNPAASPMSSASSSAIPSFPVSPRRADEKGDEYDDSDVPVDEDTDGEGLGYDTEGDDDNHTGSRVAAPLEQDEDDYRPLRV